MHLAKNGRWMEIRGIWFFTSTVLYGCWCDEGHVFRLNKNVALKVSPSCFRKPRGTHKFLSFTYSGQCSVPFEDGASLFLLPRTFCGNRRAYKSWVTVKGGTRMSLTLRCRGTGWTFFPLLFASFPYKTGRLLAVGNDTHRTSANGAWRALSIRDPA